jgi:hypothetical protein
MNATTIRIGGKAVDVSEYIRTAQERLERAEAKITKYNLFIMISSMDGLIDKYNKQVGVSADLIPRVKVCESFIENQENCLALIKIEMMIYKALINRNTKRAIYPLLKQKYAENMLKSYELAEQLVALGGISEGDWVEYAKDSLDQKKYIEMMCDYAKDNAVLW